MTVRHATVGTFNVFRGVADVHPFADIIGFQEVWTPEGKQKVRTLDGYASRNPAGLGCAIAWDLERFEAAGPAVAVVTHPGRRLVTPHRGFVAIELREHGTGAHLMVVNTHFVSSAWSAPRPTTRYRRDMWRLHRARLVKFLQSRDVHNAVLLGDMNRHNWLGIGIETGLWAVQPTRYNRAPYDQIYATPDLEAGPARRGRAYGSDHHAWSSQIVLRT